MPLPGADGRRPEAMKMIREPEKTEGNIKKPIKRTVLIGSAVFFVLLTVTLLALSYLFITASLHDKYNAKLDNVLVYVRNNTDADDLRTCIETGEKSEKYRQLQQFLNGMVDDLELEYLYIVIPSEKVMTNVISATSKAERAAGEPDSELLETTDAYPEKELKRFLSYWDTDRISYFEETSDYGRYYTGCLPLRDSRGNTVALICADLSIDNMYQVTRTFMLTSLAVITMVCGVGFMILYSWLRNTVTEPIRRLEKSTRIYSEHTRRTHDFSSYRFVAPSIPTENEVRSLADTVEIMADDMQKAVEELLETREKMKFAEEEAKTTGKADRAQAYDLLNPEEQRGPGMRPDGERRGTRGKNTGV